jgi:hypothetical protein
MTLLQALTALNVLQEYPELREYIKNFNGCHGFMYTVETDPQRIRLNKQLDEVLYDDNHSGSSWGSMIRTVKDVLNGVLTREELIEQVEEETRVLEVLYKEMRRNDLEIEAQHMEAQHMEAKHVEAPPPYSK